MKTISLLQPWATLVAIGAKKIETRSWSTDYRGPLLIHASKKFSKLDKDLSRENHYFASALRDHHIDALPLGAIVGRVFLREVRTTTVVIAGGSLSSQEREFGNYSYGRWAWFFDQAEKFNEPIAAKGRLGIWDFSDQNMSFSKS